MIPDMSRNHYPGVASQPLGAASQEIWHKEDSLLFAGYNQIHPGAAMPPDMRRNRYLDAQLGRQQAESRNIRLTSAVKQRAMTRELEWLQRSQPAPESLAEEVPPRQLPPRWHELPGCRNDLLEAELTRARYESEHLRDRASCDTMRRYEHEVGTTFGDHWALESELRKLSLEGETRDILEGSKAWIAKHKDLASWPREMENWHISLEKRENELLQDGWDEKLLDSRIERKACARAFPNPTNTEIEERLGLMPLQPAKPVDLPGAVAMRAPCTLEREIEARLQLSTCARVIDSSAEMEAKQDRELERELEERLGLSPAAHLG